MPSRHLLGRREFLIVSSTCAAAAATVGPKLFAGESAPPKRLAVGFSALEENAAVVAASSIPSGDGAFIGRGARVTVSGASGTPFAEPRARRAVELLAHFSYLDGEERRVAPFRAWACNRVAGGQGNPVGFTVPVDEVQKLVFSVRVERGAPEGAASRRDALLGNPTESAALPLVLTVQNEEGAFKLARGFYVIVPMFENDSEPRWSAWTLRPVDGRWQLVDAGGQSAPFEHFVLRIDYAISA